MFPDFTVSLQDDKWVMWLERHCIHPFLVMMMVPGAEA
jgi:hypothetical protein